MEKIPVFYEILQSGDSFQSGNTSFNAFELHVPAAAGGQSKQEVYLLDIQQYFARVNIGSSFQYFGAVNINLSSWVPLYSTLSVVPVLSNGRIYMRLIKCGGPPIIPISQCEAFTASSRRNIYSNKFSAVTDNSTMDKPHKQFMNRNAGTKSSTSFGDPDNPNRLLRTSSNNSIGNGAGSGNDSLNGFQAFVSDETVETVTALAGAAKEVAGAAARSLFNFAATSIKNVSQNIAAAANSGVVNLGNMKVIILRELAEGGFGKVYTVQDASTGNAMGRKFALKQMLCQSREQEDEALRELEALKRFCHHTNIIELIDYGSYSSKQHNNHRIINLLFPLCPQGSAWDVVDAANPNDVDGIPWPFSQRRALQIILGIARALGYIHEHGCSHRDVKPHNILLSDEGIPLLTDFGSISPAREEIANRQQALILEEDSARKTSAPYRAPELTSVPHPCSIDERVDIWGLGCTLYCLAFGRSPFESRREGVLRLAILNGKFTFPSGNRMRDAIFSDSFCNLISMMLHLEMSKRPFASELISRMEKELQ